MYSNGLSLAKVCFCPIMACWDLACCNLDQVLHGNYRPVVLDTLCGLTGCWWYGIYGQLNCGQQWVVHYPFHTKHAWLYPSSMEQLFLLMKEWLCPLPRDFSNVLLHCSRNNNEKNIICCYTFLLQHVFVMHMLHLVRLVCETWYITA